MNPPERIYVEAAGPRLLMVEDDQQLSSALGRWLRREGYEVTHASSGREAIKQLQDARFDLMLLDISLPDCSGWDILDSRPWRESMPATLAFTGQAEIEGAVKAMRLGAIDYIPKPASPSELGRRLRRALTSGSVRRSSPDQLRRPDASPVAESPSMVQVLRLAERVARSPSTSTLILGESGAGKEVVAEHIHLSSNRARGPFIRINLAAMPATMIEAELFGSVRGAYTGASRERPGLFAAAEGGTLLLDELCEFDIGLQAKLLRALESRRYFAVGSDDERTMDVRILAATNRDPIEAIAAGTLREDLYYRLSAVTLVVPPLRSRPEDILPIAERFLRRFATDLERPQLELSAAACKSLLRHSWPGNIRELRNVIERACVLAPRRSIEPADLGLDPCSDPPAVEQHFAHNEEAATSTTVASGSADVEVRVRIDPELDLATLRDSAVAAVERASIELAIERANGNLTRAASLLSVSRSTLWAKMQRYDMSTGS